METRQSMSSKRKCWVPTCLNSDLETKKRSFSLPENAQTREVWLALSGKPTEPIPMEEIFFCQDHFSTQDILRMDENKHYHNKNKILPINYMPDRMCGTCMSLIPPEQSFHIVSSKFPSEVPPVIKEILNFMVPSEPEPLHQIITFCMKDLKLPRDPPPVVCNECYTNAWLYFVFKMTCIEVEKDLKADMSWENYGKKVLCRSCPQVNGTNFISLLTSPSMAAILQNMFIGHCPPPEIVPLQVCITCYNVLERIDKFHKNCLEAEEKMKRHIALEKKFNRKSDSSVPASSASFTRSSANNRLSGITIQSERGPLLGFPVEKGIDKVKIENVVSSRTSKLLLAQLMIEHGQPLKNDLYQEDIWSLICAKMQQQGVSCNVPGLMKVWREMVQDTKTKFDTKQTIGPSEKLVMEFHKATQNLQVTTKSTLKSSTAVSSSEPTSIVPPQEHKEKKFKAQAPEKTIPVLEDERRPVGRPRTKKKPIDLPAKMTAWTDENKVEFLEIFQKEYNQCVAKIEDIGNRRPWKIICSNIASGGYYTIKDDSFFYRLWINMRSKAKEDNKNKPSLLTRNVLIFLRKDNMYRSGKPLPLTNEEKTELIRLCDKHMNLNRDKWPAQPEFWEAVTKDFAKLNPLHNVESLKRGYKNLRIKMKGRLDAPHDELDKLIMKHLENHPAGYLEKLEQKKKDTRNVPALTSDGNNEIVGPDKNDSSQQPSINQSPTTKSSKDTSGKTADTSAKRKKTKLADEVVKIFDSLSEQRIIALDRALWTTIIKELVMKNGGEFNFNSAYADWRSIRMNATEQKNDSNPMYVQVRKTLKKLEEIMEKKATGSQPNTASKSPTSPMNFTEKRKFVDDVIREYDSLADRSDDIIACKSPWSAIIQRVADKTPGMVYAKAYSMWSRFRVSARSHEKDGSDPFDVQIWNLLKRHQEMLDTKKADANVVVDATVPGSPVKKTANGDTKKRASDEPDHQEPKRKKCAVMDASAFNKLQPKQLDEILALLRDAYEKMRKAKEPDLRWKLVIDRIYQEGGYKDFSYKDFVFLFNRMRSNLSQHKTTGELTPFDEKLDALLKKVAGDKQARCVERLQKPPLKSEKDCVAAKEPDNAEGSKRRSQEKKPSVKYEKDYAYKPSRKMAHEEDGGKAKEVDKVAEMAGGPRKRKSASHVMFNVDEFYESDGSEKMVVPSKKQTSWTNAEKLALVAAAKTQGNAIFQITKTDQAWDKILQHFRSGGYQRSLRSIQWYWRYMRKHAEMAWANQTESTDVDEVVIDFMTTAIREKEKPEAGSSSDSDSRDKTAEERVVDLTYDYVSFDDIERLSMDVEGATDKVNVKSEHKEVVPDVNDSHIGIDEVADENPDHDFVLTKIEGGIEDDIKDFEIENSQPEFVTADLLGLNESKVEFGLCESKLEIEEYTEEETTIEKDSVFEEMGQECSEPVTSDPLNHTFVDKVMDFAVQDS